MGSNAHQLSTLAPSSHKKRANCKNNDCSFVHDIADIHIQSEWLCRSPQVESALVYGVQPTGLLLYLPKYGMRSAVHLTDRAGQPKPPLKSTEEKPDDSKVLARRDRIKLTSGNASPM